MDKLIQETLNAVVTGQWWVVASTVVVLLTMAFRGLLASKLKWLAWFNTDRGGVVSAAFFTLAGGFAHSTAAGHAPTLEFWLVALKVFLGAVGQYVSVRKLVKKGGK